MGRIFFERLIMLEEKKLTEMLVSEDETTAKAGHDGIYEKESKKCLKRAYRLVRHSYEDIVQETFIKLWQERKTIVINQGYKRYLYTILKNTAISLQRKIRSEKNRLTELQNRITDLHKMKEFSYEPFIRMQECIDDTLIDEIGQKYREKLLSQLKPDYEKVFKRRYEGLQIKEIADELGIPQGTVGTRLKKAIQDMNRNLHVIMQDINAELHFRGEKDET